MKRFIAAAILTTITPLAHGEVISTTFVAEPGYGDIAGFTTYAMRVETSTDWTNADLVIDLTQGTLRHLAGGFPSGPVAQIQGLGDTGGFVPNAPGMLTDATNSSAAHTESETSLNTSWFNTATDDIGTFDIAMITLSNDAEGSIFYRTIAGADFMGSLTEPEFVITNGAIGLPVTTTDPVLVGDPVGGSIIDLTADFLARTDSGVDVVLSNGGDGDLGDITADLSPTGGSEDIFDVAVSGLDVDVTLDLAGVNLSLLAPGLRTADLTVTSANGGSLVYSVQASIPEPASAGLVSLLLAGLAGVRRRV